MAILVSLLPYFRDKPENIATRGLHSVLNSKAAFAGFQTLLRTKFGWDQPLEAIGVQEGEGDNQPDLTGITAANTKVFFGEVKFNAGLTVQQPCGYLEELPAGGLLLFIVPKWRRVELWQELLLRLQIKGLMPNGPLAPSPDDCPHLIDNDGRLLALVTGSDLLETLLKASEEAGDADGSGDIRQLQALWETYELPDLPPVSEDILNYSGLAELICGLAELPRKIARARNAPNARAGSMSGCTSVDPVNVGVVSGWVVYSPANWKKYGISPIWFETWNRAPRVPEFARPAVRAAFANRAKQPGDTPWMSASYPAAIAVPLTILPNSSEDVVLKNIVQQLDNLEKAIRDSIPN